MAHADLGRKTRGGVKGDAAQTFIRKVNRNSQTCFFNEEALHFVHGPHVFLDVRGIDAFGALGPAIEVFVDVGDAVLPDLILPLRRGQLVFQYAVVAVQGSGLAGLLFQRHLRKQILNAFIDVSLRVFINIHPPVLV